MLWNVEILRCSFVSAVKAARRIVSCCVVFRLKFNMYTSYTLTISSIQKKMWLAEWYRVELNHNMIISVELRKGLLDLFRVCKNIVTLN
jgi:hypothetical protein